jgi:hypothetical protein
MPGANSRWTSSATKWKTLTPFSIFQGIVTPLGVSTGR